MAAQCHKLFRPISERGSASGFTLIEVLFALTIFGIVALVPMGLMNQSRFNARTDYKTGAIAAAQQRLDSLRFEDPTTLPSSGTQTTLVTIGDDRTSREYAVSTSYCANPAFCTTTNNRHIRVQVFALETGKLLYTAETVYTQLR